MYSEDALLPISALQHLLFCERQWGLIHLEQQWQENRLTAQGHLLHKRVHEAETEVRPNLIVARSLHLRSLQLGLTGQADAVELQRREVSGPDTIALPGRSGNWRVFPVEYKRGRPKSASFDEVQLCAQALCLEEMLAVTLASGALFYGETRRRTDVPFDLDLRRETIHLCARMHQLYSTRITPPAEYAKRCESCSLIHICLPRKPAGRAAVERYMKTAVG